MPSQKVLIVLVYLGALMHARATCAEAFGNNSVTIPRVGMAFFDTPVLYHKKPWGLSHQWTVGSSFMQAINYRWWWLAETSIGFGKLTDGARPYIGSFNGGAGIRFNIFEGDVRPHVSMLLNYLHFLGDGAKDLPLNLGWPIFVGLRPTVGLEWLFYPEMALAIEGGYGFYLNINEPFRQILYTHASFAIYF